MVKETTVKFLPGRNGVRGLNWVGNHARRQYIQDARRKIERVELRRQQEIPPSRRGPTYGNQTKLIKKHRKPHTSFKGQKQLVEERYVSYGSPNLRADALSVADAAKKVGIRLKTAQEIL